MDNPQVHELGIDPTADTSYVAVEKQLNQENDDDKAFDFHLLEGEEIIREFRTVNVVQGKPRWLILVLSVLTLGLYYVWVYYLTYCKTFALSNNRKRLALTSKGRIMMWQTGMEGTRASDGSASFDTETSLMWFHVDDVNSLQLFIRGEYLCGPIPQLGSRTSTVLRLFLGKFYPSVNNRQAHNVVDSGAIAGIQRPQWMTGSFVEQGTTEEERMVRDSTGPVGFVVALLLLSVRFLRRDVVSYVRSTLCVLMELRHVVTFAIWYQPEENAIPWEVDALGDYSIDLVSTFDAKIRDGYHDDNVQGTWKELTSLARGIADCKSSKRVFPDLQEPDHMVLESNPPDLARAFDENLIADNRVQVNRSKIPLGTTEKVLNAIPIKPRLTWMEFLCFPMILRKRKYQSNSAAILTNERAISISEYRPYQSVYEIGMTLYYIGDIGGGISVEDTKGHQGCSVDVCTPYGALRVNPIWSDLWPWSSTVGEGSYYNDLKRFVKTFQNACKGTQVLTPPQQRNVSGEELQRAKDVAGISESDTEKICSVVTCNEKQKDLEPFARFPPLAMISCGDVKCLGNLLETVTCGVRPIKRAQRLILTTHKLLAEHHVTNEEKAVQRTYTVWAPLTEVPALRTRGSFDLAPPGCCYWRCAAGIPICSRTSRRIDIEAGLSRSFDEAPLRLAQITFDVRQGPLELDDSNAMMNFVKEFNKYLLIKPVNEGIEREILNDRYGRGLPFPNGRGSYRYRPDDPTAQPEDIAVDVPPQGDSKEV